MAQIVIYLSALGACVLFLLLALSFYGAAKKQTPKANRRQNEQSPEISITRKRWLDREIHRACARCRAPARFIHHESIRTGWPELYVEASDPRRDRIATEPGAPCLHCGVRRPQPETLGKIEFDDNWMQVR